MNILFLDCETYSEVPIKNGVPRYAEKCEIMLVQFAIDDGPVEVWDRTVSARMPDALKQGLADSEKIVAHGAAFERAVFKAALGIELPLEKLHCTMAQANAHSLPGALEKLCDILGVPQDKAKHKTGKALIQLFCKPRPKNHKLRRATKRTHPAEWAQFVAYAGNDVEAMRDIYFRLPTWNYRGRELELWRLDQKINERGVQIDLDLTRAAIRAVEIAQQQCAARTQEITDNAIESTNQRDKLLEHLLAQYGVALPDMQAGTLERRIEDPDLPEPVRELLGIRLMASGTSVAKYRRLLNGVSSDGRLRALLLFCGALRTARWSGRLFQPQNLPRPPKHLKALIELGIAALKAGVADLIFDNVLELAATVVRGAIIAGPGKKLVVPDLANIEGRKLAWLAGEQWKLDAFAADRDLYVLGYARSFGVSEQEVLDDEAAGGIMRLIGKVQELALGYQGAVGAFSSMAKLYGVDLPEDRVLEIVRGWREANPNIVRFWYELEKVVRRAIRSPGNTFACRMLKVRRDKNWLRIALPSGRALCYPQPMVDEEGKISYMGVNQYSRRWERIHTYGGKLVENVTQASARDVMAWNMPAVESAGYEIVLTVHDEVLAEAPDSPEYSAEHMSGILATVPPWAEGLPLAAKGFEAYRYRKD